MEQWNQWKCVNNVGRHWANDDCYILHTVRATSYLQCNCYCLKITQQSVGLLSLVTNEISRCLYQNVQEERKHNGDIFSTLCGQYILTNLSLPQSSTLLVKLQFNLETQVSLQAADVDASCQLGLFCILIISIAEMQVQKSSWRWRRFVQFPSYF